MCRQGVSCPLIRASKSDKQPGSAELHRQMCTKQKTPGSHLAITLLRLPRQGLLACISAALCCNRVACGLPVLCRRDMQHSERILPCYDMEQGIGLQETELLNKVRSFAASSTIPLTALWHTLCWSLVVASGLILSSSCQNLPQTQEQDAIAVCIV